MALETGNIKKKSPKTHTGSI